MSRVLVTGATGFIGRQVVPLLAAAGHDVHAVYSRMPGADTPGVRWHRADLLNTGASTRLVKEVAADVLVHLAWYAEPGKYWTSPRNHDWLTASLELARAFADVNGRRIVGAGTSAEYDWSVGGVCRENETPLRPSTLYGECKLELWHRLQLLGSATGTEVAWGRVFFLYGPHEPPDRLVSSAIRAMLRGEPARSTHGAQVRDFLHVQDVASAFVALANSPVMGPVNIASGMPVSLRHILEIIAAHIGRPDLLALGAIPARVGEPATLVGDVRRLCGEVGWTQTLSLPEGVKQTVEWWRGHLE